MWCIVCTVTERKTFHQLTSKGDDETMKMNEILDAISSLASSQGFYGLLLCDLMEAKKNDPEWYGEIKRELEEKKFGSVVDMVLFFEC